MGNTTRAERISGKGTNGAMKSILFHTFNKCGNCVLRISCLVEGMLKTGGHKDPLGKILKDLEHGCSKTKQYKSTGILAKNVAKVVGTECNGCNKFEICVDNILNHRKIEDKVVREKIHVQARICVKCPDLENCCQRYSEEFRIRSYRIILRGFLLLFRRCKKDNMQMVSLDLENMEKAKLQQQVINITSDIPVLPEHTCNESCKGCHK